LENESNILASRNEELVKENRELSSYLNEARENINELKTFIAEEPNFIQTVSKRSIFSTKKDIGERFFTT
jgi:hypothetical protein